MTLYTSYMAFTVDPSWARVIDRALLVMMYCCQAPSFMLKALAVHVLGIGGRPVAARAPLANIATCARKPMSFPHEGTNSQGRI